MIAFAAGLALIALIAVVVTFVDAVRAPRWREVAAQRRLAWDRGPREQVGVGSHRAT